MLRSSLFKTLKQTLVSLYEKDQYLFNKDVHERTITSRFAHYLENTWFFWNYQVDCEYNRNWQRPKVCNKTHRYPDIIVHVRSKNTDNLLIIEAKKLPSTIGKNEDIEKIKCFMKSEEYNYKFGCFLGFWQIIESTELIFFYKTKWSVIKMVKI